ncbi:hypothetical protein GCM10009111_17830 [Colwellia asteriadis]|uniref:Uncharacterized protein n=1 Tax=Colwellia asteriadis TaxID=517723 RepID=A0ABP3WG58_9GAMM
MQNETTIPDYLSEDFFLYLENMESLTDPENPDLLSNYLKVLASQLSQDSSIFTGLIDQLAMAINPSIRINSKELAKLDLNQEPNWSDVKPFVGVHANARATITELMNHSEQALKTAVLLNHFYNSYDATPLASLKDEDESEYDTYSDDYDEQY